MVSQPSADYKVKIILIEFILAILLFLSSMHLTKKTDALVGMKNVCLVTAFFSTVFIACDLFFNFVSLLVYYPELNRQNISFYMALNQILDTNLAAIIYNTICIVLFIILIILQGSAVLHFIWNFSAECSFLCILLAWLLHRSTSSRFLTNPVYSPVGAATGLDYGTGMAYSYYYGYLRVVLPSTGTATKGILEKMKNVEDAHNITFATHKLLILCPASSYIPPDLKEHSNQWMESAIPLEADVRDRAGVKQRSYKNSIYKIYPDGRDSGSRPLYIVAEGATPLLTFYEVQKHSHPESSIYKEHSREIIYKFYTKLKELIEDDPECRNVCEVLYYNDRTSDGAPVNVAKVILQKIEALGARIK